MSVTYDDGHGSAFDTAREKEQEREDLPSRLTLLSTPTENDQVRDEGHALEDDGKGHEEADAPPHGTEVPIWSMTVVVLWEVIA